jgi:HPt (histidine-containing phosphotransfer) domain-containing protein
MPGLQGAELVQQLRAAAQPETRIIAMSASAPPVTPATPWDAFLLKPFSVDDFHHVLTSTQLHEFTTESHSNTILDDTIFTRLASMIPAAQLRELYKITLADVQNRLQRMQSATTAGDLDTVRAEAHAIKGGCGMVGAVELARIAASVEAGSHTESPFTIFAAACARLQSMLDARL